jgi:hypothetical protein
MGQLFGGREVFAALKVLKKFLRVAAHAPAVEVFADANDPRQHGHDQEHRQGGFNG